MSDNYLPRVTVGLAVYNGEKYIHETIESVLNQTYKNFDFIISDNNSIDRTIEICEKYLKTDSRIKIIRNKVNVGAINNMNNIFYYSINELPNNSFFNLIAYDDLWDPTYLEKSVKKLSENENALLCNSSVKVLFPDGTEDENESKGFRYKSIETISVSLEEKLNLLWTSSNWFPFYGLFRVEKLKPIMPMPCVYGADLVFLTRAILSGDFVAIKERLFFYRMIKKNVEQYQAIFFADNKKEEKPFTQTFVDCVKEILSVDLSHKRKLSLVELFCDTLIILNYDFKYILEENNENLKKLVLKGLFLDLVVSYFENNISNNKKDLENIDFSNYKNILLSFFEKNDFRSFNNIVKLLPIEQIDNDLKYLISISNIKSNNTILSSSILKKLLEKESGNLNYLNNFIVSEFNNNNFDTIKDIFVSNVTSTLSLNILDNFYKIFRYLNLDDHIQSSLNYSISTKSNDVVSFIKNRINTKNKITIIIYNFINLNNIISTIKKQFNYNYSNLEIYLILDKNDNDVYSNYDLDLKKEFFNSKNNESIFCAINNAIKKSKGVYISLFNEELNYPDNYFNEVIKKFDHLDDDTKLIYGSFKIGEHPINLFKWDIKQFLSNLTLKNRFYLLPFLIWKKDLNDVYGYFNEENEIVAVLLDFLLRVSQTYSFYQFKDLYVSYPIDSNISLEFKNCEKIIDKYLLASQESKTIDLVKEKPILKLVDYGNTLIIDNLDRTPFEIDFDFSYKEPNKGKYIILIIKSDSLEEKDIEHINKIYDQIWFIDSIQKEKFINMGLDQYRIRFLELDNIDNLVINFIDELKNNPILRENLFFYQNKLLEKAKYAMKNNKYNDAELYLKSLFSISILDYSNYLDLGICLFKQSKYQESLDYLSEYISYSDLSYDLCFMIAKCLEMTGDIETSKEYYEQANKFVKI